MPLPAKPIFLKIGRKLYEVTNFEQASVMFCKARDASGLGASKIGQKLIVDEAGAVVAHVSYNGRVWPGANEADINVLPFEFGEAYRDRERIKP